MNIFILFPLFVYNFSFLYIYLQITKIYNEGEISKFKFLIYQIKPYRLFCLFAWIHFFDILCIWVFFQCNCCYIFKANFSLKTLYSCNLIISNYHRDLLYHVKPLKSFLFIWNVMSIFMRIDQFAHLRLESELINNFKGFISQKDLKGRQFILHQWHSRANLVKIRWWVKKEEWTTRVWLR